VTIELAPHDRRWAQRFRAEAATIREALGDVVIEIEHVGSTSVPGLAAKPTVDIAVGVTTLALPDGAVERMEALGYEAAADSRPEERRFRRGPTFPREAIVHLVEWGGRGWIDYLRFRDALRADPELARRYEALKRSLLQKRGDWYRGVHKQAFIEEVLARARPGTEMLSSSPEETEAIAGSVARELRVGDVVTVSGELGTGKTTFVRGACRALGVTAPVTSPTYTIGHRYEGDPDVSHLDLYRFTGVSAAEWGDLEPYFEDAIVFVEWPEAAGSALPAARLRVRLGHVDPATRSIRLDGAEAGLVERLGRADPGVRHRDGPGDERTRRRR